PAGPRPRPGGRRARARTRRSPRPASSAPRSLPAVKGKLGPQRLRPKPQGRATAEPASLIRLVDQDAERRGLEAVAGIVLLRIVGLFIAVPPADIVVAHGVLDDGEHLVAFVGVQGMARGETPAALDLLRVAGGEALAGVVAVEADDIGHLLALDVDDPQHLPL